MTNIRMKSTGPLERRVWMWTWRCFKRGCLASQIKPGGGPGGWEAQDWIVQGFLGTAKRKSNKT